VSPRNFTAAQVIESTLSGWLALSYPNLDRRGLRSIASLANDERITRFSDWLASLPFLNAAFWLSSAYARLAGDDTRRSRALFFTPPDLSERLILNLCANGAPLATGRLIDPACGGAAFLAPVAIRVRDELKTAGVSPRRILAHLEKHLFGIDIDPVLCRLCGMFLKMVLCSEILESGYKPKFKIQVANSLVALKDFSGKFDVVIGNPPYRKMPAEEVAYYRDSYAEVIGGQPNLYALFFALGLRLLKRGGLAALVTPTSFLSGQYFSKLRSHLLLHSDTTQIDIVDERVGVFVGVEQETAVTLLKKRAPQKIAPALTNVHVVSRTGRFESAGQCTLPNSGAAWPVPRTRDDMQVLQLFEASAYRLVDYGYAARIGAFVWNRDKRAGFRAEKDARRRARAPFPLVWSRDIRPNGSFKFNRQGGPDAHVFVDMQTTHSPSVIRRPCVALQRVTSSDQPRRLVAAPISQRFIDRFGGFVGENHVVLVEPRVPSPPIAPQDLAKVLASLIVDRLFRCISGAANVSVFELEQLPLPDPQILSAQLRLSTDVDSVVARAFELTRRRQMRGSRDG